MEVNIGTILPWAPSFAPQGWALCQGQDLTIAQYQALYSLLGTVYGQSSATTFKLPNLSGRVPVGAGVLNGIPYNPGQSGGNVQVTLTNGQVPLASHIHTITNTVSATGGGTGTVNMDIKIPINTDNQPTPLPTPPTYVNTPNANCTLGQAKAGSMVANIYTTNPPTAGANLKPFTASANVTVSAPTLSVTSQCAPAGVAAVQPVPVMQPYQVVNYIIALEGYYPIRP